LPEGGLSMTRAAPPFDSRHCRKFLMNVQAVDALRQKLKLRAADSIQANDLDAACISKLKRLDIAEKELQSIADDTPASSSATSSTMSVSGSSRVKSAFVKISGGD
jgi:hypothetical protein